MLLAGLKWGAMSEYRSHLSVTTWIVLVSLTFGVLVTIPERVYTVNVFGSPVDFRFSAAFLAGMVALAATWAGLEAALRTHPRKELLQHTYLFWGLPTAIVLTGAVLLPTLQNQSMWLITLGVTGAALAASMAGEYHTVDPDSPGYGNARLLLNVLAYAVAAVAFILVYLSRSRSLVSATLIGLIAGLLALDLLRGSQARNREVFLFSALVAFILAQFTVVLNYWPFASVRVALILLVGYYLLVGLAQQALRRDITRRRVIEYLVMFVFAVALIFFFPA
jgi:hypothetical protein